MVNRIQECATTLGITLVEKEVDDIDTSNFQLREQSLPADFLSTPVGFCSEVYAWC